jgi:hypothetical protein
VTRDPQMRWLRLWTDIIDDEKLGLLAFEDRWHYVAILCLKRRGVLDCGDDDVTRDRKVGMKLGLGDSDRDALRKRLAAAKLTDEGWQPVGWENRQFSSDCSSDRVRKLRRKVKRFRNVSSPLPKRSGNGSETETESESESEKSPLPPLGLDRDSWERFSRYRTEIRRPVKPASMLAAQRQLAAFGTDQAAVVDQTIANGWQGLFALKPISNGVTPRITRKPRTVAELEAEEAMRNAQH